MSQDVLIGFVLDQSGSMAPLSRSTIEGFNQMLGEQKELDGNAWLSLTVFDTRFDVRYAAWGIKDVSSLGSATNPYTPGGGTALYDAFCATVDGIEAWLKNNPWFSGKVVIMTWTDGYENSSRQFTLDDVNNRIKSKTDAGWEFAMLGAGGAGWLEAKNFATPVYNTAQVQATDRGYRQAYAGVSSSLRSLRSNASSTLNLVENVANAEVDEEISQ